MDNPVVSNVFGTLGAVLWSIQLIPQIILNYRRHSAEGFSAGFMLTWAFAGVPLGVYNIAAGFNVALQVQAQILIGLTLVAFAQCLYYQRSWSVLQTCVLVIPLGATLGGIELGLVFALRRGFDNGMYWPKALMAVLAAVLLCLGVAEQYVTIIKTRSVAGISVLFCGLDASGDVASMISVLFERKLDVLGLVIYSVEFVFWMGIFGCVLYFRTIPALMQWRSQSRHVREGKGSGSDLDLAASIHEV